MTDEDKDKASDKAKDKTGKAGKNAGDSGVAIARLERLSSLRLPDRLREEMEAKTFTLISSWFAKVRELDTKGKRPLVNTREFHKDTNDAEGLALREDVARADAKREDLLANAPESEHGFFIVPKVVE